MQPVQLQVTLTAEQKAELITELAAHIRGVAFDVARKTAKAMQDPMREMPLVATAGFWAKQKGKNNGETYSAATFRKWAKDNGISPMRQSGASFYSREDARKWIFENDPKNAPKPKPEMQIVGNEIIIG